MTTPARLPRLVPAALAALGLLLAHVPARAATIKIVNAAHLMSGRPQVVVSSPPCARLAGMRFVPRVLAPLIALLSLASCGIVTRFDTVWHDPTAKGPMPRKVLVLALTKEPEQQRTYEEGMAIALARRGLEVVMGSELFAGGLPDSAAARERVKDAGVDLAIVGRLVGLQQRQQFVAGNLYYTPTFMTEGFYGWTYSSWAIIQDPGSMQHIATVRLDNRAFDVATQRVVWSGLTHTTDAHNAEDLMSSVSGAVVKELVKHKLLP